MKGETSNDDICHTTHTNLKKKDTDTNELFINPWKIYGTYMYMHIHKFVYI